MSIVTRGGDKGLTSLMFGHRVSKTDPIIEAVGAVDELNTALGAARAAGLTASNTDTVDSIQRALIGLMGELSCRPEDVLQYETKGYAILSADNVVALGLKAVTLESAAGPSYTGWARPGMSGHMGAALLEVARTACRRAERRVLGLGGHVSNKQITVYLNRTSDVLWLLARDEERNK
jgi:cob(I)alamin adenosyltransferase